MEDNFQQKLADFWKNYDPRDWGILTETVGHYVKATITFNGVPRVTAHSNPIQSSNVWKSEQEAIGRAIDLLPSELEYSGGVR